MDYPALRNATLGKEQDGTFYRRGPHGFIELVDKTTGAVVSIQESYSELPSADFVETEIDGQKYLVQSGVSLPTLGRKRHPFSRVLADIIVQKIIEGVDLTRLCLESGMPDKTTLARWRRENPDFDKEIRFAKQVRAEGLRDEIHKTAMEAAGKLTEEIGGDKMKIDALKWLVERENPSEYGNKVQVGGQIGVTHIVIETGIRRRGDEGYRDPVDIVAEKVVEKTTEVAENVGQ